MFTSTETNIEKAWRIQYYWGVVLKIFIYVTIFNLPFGINCRLSGTYILWHGVPIFYEFYDFAQKGGKWTTR